MTQPAVTVAYLGPAGTFTEAALIRFQGAGAFGAGEVEQLPVSSPREALDALYRLKALKAGK